jgi:hypothetical protein
VSGVSSMITSTPVASSNARMFRPSRPMIRPFISSLGSDTLDTVVSAVCSAAIRWTARATIFLASRSAFRRAVSRISRTPVGRLRRGLLLHAPHQLAPGVGGRHAGQLLEPLGGVGAELIELELPIPDHLLPPPDFARAPGELAVALLEGFVAALHLGLALLHAPLLPLHLLAPAPDLGLLGLAHLQQFLAPADHRRLAQSLGLALGIPDRPPGLLLRVARHPTRLLFGFREDAPGRLLRRRLGSLLSG